MKSSYPDESIAALRHHWMKINYLIAIALAMVGWLWLFVWIAKKIF